MVASQRARACFAGQLCNYKERLIAWTRQQQVHRSEGSMGYRAPRMSKDCCRVGALKRRVAPLVTDAQTCAMEKAVNVR